MKWETKSVHFVEDKKDRRRRSLIVYGDWIADSEQEFDEKEEALKKAIAEKLKEISDN